MSLRADLRVRLEHDLRLAILQVLHVSGEGFERELNNGTLRTALAGLGHRPSAEDQRGHVDWLEERKLVSTERVSASFQRIHLTERGFDVAEGRASEPGVARPGPGHVV